MKAKKPGRWRLETSCVHAGEGTDTDTRAIRRPIHMASLPLEANILSLNNH